VGTLAEVPVLHLARVSVLGDNEPNTTPAAMKTSQAKPQQPALRASHLTVRPEGEGADVRTLFDSTESHVGRARVLSGVVVHVVGVVLLLVIAQFVPEKVYETILPERLSADIIWLADPGPGGGGGGGNESPEPPRPAELPGEEKITVPAAKPPDPTPEPQPEEPPELPAELTIPAQTLAAASDTVPGAIGPPPAAPSDSRGSGTGSGAGPGRGSGLGPGTGGGVGGGVYQPGNGVTLPVVIREVKPQYTAEAMRAKVQGTVWLECVVLPDGSVGPVEVVRSLDSSFGLDQEAVRAAKQWRFRPGMRFGEPVAVLVTIELTFTLR
jgi:periplasmic protein TonB